MKRKNGARACNPPDTENDGVDLNRNFGFKWNYDSIGSSPRGCSEEYRGTGAFSEPETQAIRTVSTRYAVKSILHWHGWGNDVAFPYSYDWRAPMTNDDLGMYQEFATEMAAANHYASGRAWESVGYTTNGEADDWGWGELHAVSVTIEVGASSDGFWPPPNRILPIAQESAWPAKYLAMASGPMLQLDAVKITPVEDGRSATVMLVVQNNGLLPFTAEHRLCARSVAGQSELSSSDGWGSEEGAGRTTLCVTLPPLSARSYKTLAPLSVSWPAGAVWIPLMISSSPTDLTLVESADHAALVSASVENPVGRRKMSAGGGGGGFLAAARRNLFGGGSDPNAMAAGRRMDAPAPTSPGRSVDLFRLRIFNSASTLRGCDELCVCASADPQRIDVSHECRAAVAPGSHCKLAKPAHSGTNWASGVVDEQFSFTASSYSRGGRCTVSSTKRDTLLAVYSTCSRFGAQSPLGFANSENGRQATVTFPCTAGTTYYLFWNAEYMPGRFPFSVSEQCSGGDCTRAHRLRHLMRLRNKKKRRDRV